MKTCKGSTDLSNTVICCLYVPLLEKNMLMRILTLNP